MKFSDEEKIKKEILKKIEKKKISKMTK